MSKVLSLCCLLKKNCFAGAGETRLTQLNKHKIILNVGKPKITQRAQKICEGVMITNQSFIPQK